MIDKEREEREDRKDAMKEAMKEFLEKEKRETFETIGKWVTNTFAWILLAAFIYFMIHVEKMKN